MTTPISELVNTFADREAIRECLYRYARGVDRLDEDMLRSAYWPDAIDDHLAFKGTVDEFIAFAFPHMRRVEQAVHMIGNILITLRGNEADVETYFFGAQCVPVDREPRDVIATGRYLDRFERRGEEWRIAARTVVTDWFRNFPDSADWSQGFMGAMIAPGKRSSEDLSYELLKLI